MGKAVETGLTDLFDQVFVFFPMHGQHDTGEDDEHDAENKGEANNGNRNDVEERIWRIGSRGGEHDDEPNYRCNEQ